MVTPAGHCGAGRASLAGETWLWDGTLPWDMGQPGVSGSLCGGLNKQAAGQDVAKCLAQQGGCPQWCLLGPGDLYDTLGGGRSSAGCSGEQGPTLAVSGCLEIQGAMTCMHGSSVSVLGTGWALPGLAEGLSQGQTPKCFPL